MPKIQTIVGSWKSCLILRDPEISVANFIILSGFKQRYLYFITKHIFVLSMMGQQATNWSQTTNFTLANSKIRILVYNKLIAPRLPYTNFSILS